MSCARPADLLTEPAGESRGSVGCGEDVGCEDDAPAAFEEVRCEMTIFIDDLGEVSTYLISHE